MTNQLQCSWLTNNNSKSRSKYIDIKYLTIREHVKEKKVIIEHISIELMIVDTLLKACYLCNCIYTFSL